jgi:hypothetical protein|tara:strand:- start:615 stop:2600 length:1986 start_codon:yes stop_codon:yes gene_type:complete
MATPLIRIPQEQGGTMYAFANSARDLTRAYYNPDINFEFSKFALLDLPVYADGNLSDPNDPTSGPNYINYTNLFEGGGGENASAYSDTLHDGNGNVHFAQTFQSYALNLENMLLNPEVNDDFDDVLFQSDAEKIFFKYLYHINAIRVRTATSQEVSTGYSRMIELDDSTQSGSEYSQVIKYIGNIDVTNDKNYKGQQYNEIFVNVPSSVGYTPEVLLETSKFNTNNIKFVPGSEIEGRTSDDIHPDPFLSLESYADQSDGTYNTDENEIPTFGIDFNASAYSKIINDPKLNSVLEYSQRGGDFRFNAILVYYDIYSKSNIGNKATNLYGIILLDNWKEDTSNDGWYIPELTKYKPNEVTGLNGNAFALKLNLKFNSALDNVGIEKNVNDYSTFSMDIFLDTTSALENAVQLLKDANKRYNSISKKVEMLESFFLSSENLQGISKRLDNIEQDVENATINFQDERSLLDLITNTNSRLNQVISGVIPAEIQYNTDVLESGNTGVSIDKSSNGKVKISCVNYGYSLGQTYVYDTVTSTNERELSADSMFLPDEAGTKAVWQRLKEFDNLVRIYTDQAQSFDSNLNIYLDDTITNWKKGQVVRVTFKNKIKNLSTHYITLWTDKSNGWSQKLSISLSDLLSNKPYIEIVCVDPVNKTFEYDILR